MPDRIVHIGFPKTATTFLQWEVFPYLKEVNYVDYNACRDIFPQIVFTDRLDHDLKVLSNKMDKYEKKGATNFYSFELLAGSPFSPKGMNRSLIAESLKDVGFSRVIITVRDQAKAIDSYYRQYIVQGGTLRFRKWLDINDKRGWLQKHFSLSYLKYDLLVAHYQSLFGKENVLVVDSENFRKEKDQTIDDVCGFLGASGLDTPSIRSTTVNNSLTNLSTSILRVCNYFTYNGIRPSQFFHDSISTRNFWLLLKLILDPYFFRIFSSAKSYLKKYKLEKELKAYYAESNDELEKICSIRLK
ncbi:hypothetical protein [Ekhidna sp.]|uniref:hypothetical protein n=1 Tax=Ekhidna sp. TaxID=2608089 RepID=UPI00329878D7